MHRVEPVIAELQRSNNILVVSHQAILRCIIGFFTDKKPEEVPYAEVPLHTIIRVSSQGYNYKVDFFKLPIECVNTTRVKPNNCSADRTADDALLTVPAHFDIPDPWRNLGSGPTLVQQHWETARGSTIMSKIRCLFVCNPWSFQQWCLLGIFLLLNPGRGWRFEISCKWWIEYIFSMYICISRSL